MNIQITEGRIEQTTLIIPEKLRFVSLGNIFNPFLILFQQSKSWINKEIEMSIACFPRVKTMPYLQVCIQFFSLTVAKCILLSLKKQESSRKTSISALLTMPKPLTVWITINCGEFWKRRECQTTWSASWETYMQVRKQQLELNMQQQTGSK